MEKVIKSKRGLELATSRSSGYEPSSENSFICNILSDQVWWCNIRLLLSYFKNYICRFVQANSGYHKLFHFHLSFCIWRVWKVRKKITKIWISRERKELFRWNKKHFSEILKGYHLDTSFKRDSSSVFSCKFCKFFTEPFWTTASEVLQWTNRNQVFSIFEHVLLRLSNVMNIMNFAIGKLYFAKLARVSFLWSYILKAYNVIEKRLIMSLAFFFRDLFHRILANNSFWNCEQESIN